MGGLLKNWTIKWVSKRVIEESQQSRERQITLLLTSLSVYPYPFYRPPNYPIFAHWIKWFTPWSYLWIVLCSPSRARCLPGVLNFARCVKHGHTRWVPSVSLSFSLFFSTIVSSNGSLVKMWDIEWWDRLLRHVGLVLPCLFSVLSNCLVKWTFIKTSYVSK